MKVQLIMTFLVAQPSDKGKVIDAQQVVVFVNTFKNTISISIHTVINSFTVFMLKFFNLHCFIAPIDLRQQ